MIVLFVSKDMANLGLYPLLYMIPGLMLVTCAPESYGISPPRARTHVVHTL